MSAILRACALLARSYDSGTEPNHATLAVEPATATEAAVDARREYDSMRRDLSQARALLEDVNVSEPTASWVKRRDAFLARAPAQTAPRTTSLLCYEGDCAKMTGRARPCPVHDAPAQTAEPPGWCGCQRAMVNERRAESAEAELAVLRGRGTPSGHVVSLEAALQSAEATLAAVENWTHVHGAALKPRGADTYGEGMRDAKQQVASLLRARKGGGNG